MWPHRGRLEGSALPENTVGAIEAALRAGADGVEIDVWRCRDGSFVLQHDRTVDGVNVDEAPYGVVRLLPHLGEALDAARGAAIDVELKVPPGITAAEAYRHGAQISRQPGVITSSFNPDAARGMLAEGATAGIIVESMPARGLLEELASNGLAWLFVQGTALREGVSATRNPEVRLGTWTLNDAAGLDAARRAGCDVVITDRPRLVAALQAAEAPR